MSRNLCLCQYLTLRKSGTDVKDKKDKKDNKNKNIYTENIFIDKVQKIPNKNDFWCIILLWLKLKIYFKQ